MSRFNHNTKFTTLGIIYRLLLVCAAMAAILTLLPYGERGAYEYAVGRPWFDNTIIAREGFPLLKPDSILQKEIAQARRNYRPVYEFDPNASAQHIQHFERQFNQTFATQLPYSYRDYVKQALNKVYAQGIMTTADHEREQKEGHRSLTVSLQNNGEVREISELFTPKTAYEFILNQADSVRFRRTQLQRLNLSNYLHANLSYAKLRSESQLQAIEKSVSRYSGMIQSGQEIVHRGQIVDEQIYLMLRSMETYHNRSEGSKAEIITQRIGQGAIILIVFVCLFFFLLQFRPDYLHNLRTLSFIILMVSIFPIITYLFMRHGILLYVIPYCMVPIFLRVFTDSRTANLMHISSIMLSAMAATHPFQFIFIGIINGLVAIYSMRYLSNRSDLYRAIFYVTLSSLIGLLCFDLINRSFFVNGTPDFLPYILQFANGAILMISYLLLMPIERFFRFTSNVTLLELSNTNNEILRRLSEEAPGTFQHSMQVANLSSEVARRLDLNAQLVRTAALYHDIGKLGNPAYFTENQSGINPHDNLSNMHSAQIIISHVTEGLRLAEQHELPQVIRDFISTHHGAGTVRYFLTQEKNQHPNEPVDEAPFTYPGPNPFTAEQAILMMADTIEAASRSLKDYTEESISALVERLIDAQMSEGFFAHCPLTFEDVAQAKQVFKEKLKIIYHTRIAYPEMKK